ncbi:hypothetical protein [Marinobacter sp. F4206]|uniref:hypothetical protein n=1 Tax=Marinobacter sp. F4206 TaxID=2861777 RepID=UPI001C5F9C95|nr:hypothetical protein [Marinobacter sp. F4206]MBW4935710.1 hypothetical protein [Marinobacter sp. F4206]
MDGVMFRDAEEIIVTLPLDLAAILLVGTGVMVFHEINADLAFLFAVSAIAISRVWTMVYERRWGDDLPDREEKSEKQQAALFQKAMGYAGFELVLFLAFAACGAWILKIGLVNAAITGAVLVAAHTTYLTMAKMITEER